MSTIDAGDFLWYYVAMINEVVTLVNCIDERVEAEASAWLKWRYGDVCPARETEVDVIKMPAAVKVLSTPSKYIKQFNHIYRGIRESAARGSSVIGIAAHAGCHCNPVSKKMQLIQLDRAVWTINSVKESLGLKTVTGLWVDEDLEVTELDRVEIPKTLEFLNIV